MATLAQLHAVRAILGKDDSSIASCWLAAFVATDLASELTRASSEDPDAALEDPDDESFLIEVERAVGFEVNDFVRAKILAGKAIIFSDILFNDLPAFNDFANLAAAEDPPLPNVFNPANVYECSIAVLQIGMLLATHSPELAGKIGEQFSDPIRGYWGVVLTSEGSTVPAPPLQAAIMPTIDPLGDPLLLDAMTQAADSYAGMLQRAVWRYAINDFNLLQSLKTEDGERCIAADTMQAFMVSLVGDPNDHRANR